MAHPGDALRFTWAAGPASAPLDGGAVEGAPARAGRGAARDRVHRPQRRCPRRPAARWRAGPARRQQRRPAPRITPNARCCQSAGREWWRRPPPPAPRSTPRSATPDRGWGCTRPAPGSYRASDSSGMQVPGAALWSGSRLPQRACSTCSTARRRALVPPPGGSLVPGPGGYAVAEIASRRAPVDSS